MKILDNYIHVYIESTPMAEINLKKKKREIRDCNIVGWVFLIVGSFDSYEIWGQLYFWLYILAIFLFWAAFFLLYFILSGYEDFRTRRQSIIILIAIFLIGAFLAFNLIPYEHDNLLYLYFGGFFILMFQIIPIMQLWAVKGQSELNNQNYKGN